MRMTAIRTMIEEYVRGPRAEATLNELAEKLIAFPFEAPAVDAKPPPGSRMSTMEYSSEALGLFPTERTWQEVEAARLDGDLTNEEYWTLHDRAYKAAKDGIGPAEPAREDQ